MIFEFLIAARVRQETNLRELLVDALAETLEANNNEFDEDAVSRMIRLTHARMGDQSTDQDREDVTHALVGFTLDLPDDTTQAETVVAELAGALQDTQPIHHVVKFASALLQAELAQRAAEIFALEMKLRRVLSLIYIHANQDGDPYELLRDEKVQPINKAKPEPAQMKAAAENQFFHLTFSQYVGLNQRPDFKLLAMLKVIRSSEQYDAFREELLRDPVEHEDDAVLLAGLKERMDAIEAMRNCVAHNRRPTRRVVENYDNARPLLDDMLDDYLAAWEILKYDEDDRELYWETAAREAVEYAMDIARWDESERTITFDEDDEPPRATTVSNREDLEGYLCELASSAFYQHSPWDGGESVFECDEYHFVEPVLEQYEQQLRELFDE